MEIKTDRLLLRKFNKEDINQTYMNALNDYSIMGMTEARHVVWDQDKVEKFIENANTEDSILFNNSKFYRLQWMKNLMNEGKLDDKLNFNDIQPYKIINKSQYIK
jgi:acetyl-CoA carboxylase beta subunit